MHITGIKLANYRNYTGADIAPPPGISVFCGENAQGKTNVLEAVYLCCTGRSHRTARDRELVMWGQPQAHVRVDAQRCDGPHDVSMQLFSDRRKAIRVNGAAASRTGELMGHITGVLFSPEDLRLVKDGPEVRRRFIDMELSQIRPAYFYALQRYARALQQRNRLLKQLDVQPQLMGTLDEWDEQLAQTGAVIVLARHAFLQKLRATARENHMAISGGKEQLDITYQTRFEAGDQADVARAIRAALADTRPADLRRGSTHAGPHRDDMGILINGQEARTYGSQGQQRTAALSLKLSELDVMREVTGEWPVLMLDDVMSELDPQRRRMLIRRLSGVQVLVTLTDMADLGGAHADRVYTVSGGTVSGAGARDVHIDG